MFGNVSLWCCLKIQPEANAFNACVFFFSTSEFDSSPWKINFSDQRVIFKVPFSLFLNETLLLSGTPGPLLSAGRVAPTWAGSSPPPKRTCLLPDSGVWPVQLCFLASRRGRERRAGQAPVSSACDVRLPHSAPTPTSVLLSLQMLEDAVIIDVCRCRFSGRSLTSAPESRLDLTATAFRWEEGMLRKWFLRAIEELKGFGETEHVVTIPACCSLPILWIFLLCRPVPVGFPR